MSAPYHPGQSPWPDNQPQRPDRPAPIQFRPDDQVPQGNPWLAWTLRILGLIAIAVISGVVWWYIQNEGPKGPGTGAGGPTEQPSRGAYDFTAKLDEPQVDDSCEDHAYGDTKAFFKQTPCDGLTRSVFTTKIEDRTVYASVSVVEMSDDAKADELRKLTDTDNTGNVSDLVREGVVKLDGLTELSGGGGYAAAQQDNQVVIVEADYDPKASKDGSEEELDKVCKDAIRLGNDMVDGNGG
ncbi:MAG: hypothetical protein GEV28_33860 [Actinophytocola sp.]|uniref:hypothetical protein n=1 Tax=Actinophytocola sp. TaxID=1872138 RepID=UPI0013215056|nr:hypothetical protein [Actinophytocola sp.]MPZ85106.1 hypothetical protein [Actinophytocola sp.]